MDREGMQKLFDKFKQEKEKHVDHNSKVLIVDGLNTFIRSFAASPAMNHRGDHIGGLLGFMTSLFSYIRKFNPTRVIIAFDGKDGAKLRRDKYPEYKAGRVNKDRYNRYDDVSNAIDEEQSFIYQISRLDKYLRLLPVTSMIIDYIEADDVIGYLTNEYYHVVPTSEIIIVSSDQDFLQLISENVKVYSPTKRRLYDHDTMIKEFGIIPQNYLTLKTLTGDTSDNIRGASGIGLKTMLKLFPEFANTPLTTEDIVNISAKRIEEGSKMKTYKNVVSASSQLKLNWELMQLIDVDIPSSKKLLIKRFVETPIKKFDKHMFKQMFYEDGLNQYVEYFDSWVLSSLNHIDLYAKAD